jgi:hypothetical protein
MSSPGTPKVFEIIEALRRGKIAFTLDVTRDNAITILAVVPGQFWEIDVYVDGEVDLEVFASTGDIFDLDELKSLIDQFTFLNLHDGETPEP